MERVQRANLSSALRTIGGQLQRRLPNVELTALGALMDGMERRWPAQELADSMDAFMTDMEELARRHGLQYVQLAVMALRVSPEQKFFPRPDEIAAEMDRQRTLRGAHMDVKRAESYLAELAEWKRQWQAAS